MKIYGATVLAISCIPSTVAFVTNSHKSVNTELNLQKKIVVGPAVTGLAGLTLASQMAFAVPVESSTVQQLDVATPIVRAAGM